MQLSRCKLIAKLAHKGQLYNNRPYYDEHLVPVMEKAIQLAPTGWVDLTAQIAILHDVIEDTEVTHDDLITLGVEWTVAAGVQRLTRLPEDTYDDYITKLLYVPGEAVLSPRDLGLVWYQVWKSTIFVKKADLLTNISHNGTGNPARLDRYQKALRRVEAALEADRRN